MASPARSSAFAILLRVEMQASFAGELLRGPLTEGLSGRDAALCTEIVLGTLRWQGMLDFIAQSLARGSWTGFDPEVRVALRLGLYQLRFLSRVPERAAVHEAVELVKLAGRRSAAGLVNAVLRRAAQAELPLLRPDGWSDLQWAAVETSHPAWLLERWARHWGIEQARALALANNQAPVTFLRPAARISTGQLAQSLRADGVETAPGGLLRTALRIDRGSLRDSTGYQAGQAIIQDEASQLIPHLLDVGEGQTVLDLCAAPGNKTGLLAEWAAPGGRVIAGDLHLHRLRELLCSADAGKVHRVALDGEAPLPFRRIFDRILVDAPCSGTGTLRRNPELKWRLAPADIERLAGTQLRLLGSAAAVLREGGTLVYSTCSLEWEENQGVVQRFLESSSESGGHHCEFRLVPLRAASARLSPFLEPAAMHLLDAEFLETSPAREGTDGFFAAVLKRIKPAS